MFKKIRRKSVNRIIGDNLDNYRKDIKPESVRLYLFKTVYNLCVDRTRTGKQNLIPIESIDIEESPEDLPDQEEADRINACLGRLPQSTAKSRFKSGMDKLRKLFINNQM